MRQSTGKAVELRQTEDGKYYVPNKSAVREIVSKLEEGRYTTILGPRHNQKSLLLNDVITDLKKNDDWACVLVDLLDLRRIENSDFLNRFAITFEQQRAREEIKIENPPSSSRVTDISSLQRFLEEHSKKISKKLVLLIDHLECIHIEPLKFLLSVLIAIHKKQSTGASNKLRVVTASSSSITELSLGRPSFFDIAHSVWISDLTQSESQELIRFILGQQNAKITLDGERRLIGATNCDRYLIPMLCERCAELVVDRKRKEVSEPDVDKSVDWFINEEARSYPPLRGNVRAVASDTIALMNVLKVLDAGKVPGRKLMLDHKADVHKLQLTGAIRVEGKKGEKSYLIRNEIYERYLRDNFRPEHVPHILSIAGGWENAIPYLKRLVADFPQYRPTLLGKIVDFINTAKNESEACDYLIRQFSKAFAISKAKVYIVNPVRSHLKQISQIGFDSDDADELPLEVEDLPEVIAYKSQDYVVTRNKANAQTILVPLPRNDRSSLGVAVVYDFKGDIHGENFLELLAYFKRAGRAVGDVIDRARELLQLGTLNETGKDVTSSLDKKKAMESTVNAAIKSVPGAQRGVLFLWNEKTEKLSIEAIARRDLFERDVAKDIVLAKGQGYAGEVYATGEPLRIGNVVEHPVVEYRDHPDVKKQKSVLCVPLKAWGRIIGVLCVDNIAALDAFKAGDTELLSTFAAQAAIALQNAQLYTDLHELGLSINSGTLDIPEIFMRTVQSITRTSGAKGAHMLLLRDVDDLSTSTAEKVVLSKSFGLGEDYDDQIKPRRHGLAARVLRTGRYQAVENPEKWPRINPLASKRGVRAYICLPMKVQEIIIGVLFVYYKEEHNFAENEIEMLSLFTNQAALAIENTRQRKKLEIMEAVTWMGIEFSDMKYSIRQELAAMNCRIATLRDCIAEPAKALNELDRLEKYVKDTAAILKGAPLPFRPEPTDIELNEMLRGVIPKWCSPEEKIEIDFARLTKDKIIVKADKHLLTTVLKILTTNAVKAVRFSSEKILKISSVTKADQAVVKMTNGGQQIPVDVQNRLFKEPISKTSDGSGTGMGLLIAGSILLRSGGEIKLVKSDAKETTFSFCLPLIRAKKESGPHTKGGEDGQAKDSSC